MLESAIEQDEEERDNAMQVQTEDAGGENDREMQTEGDGDGTAAATSTPRAATTMIAPGMAQHEKASRDTDLQQILRRQRLKMGEVLESPPKQEKETQAAAQPSRSHGTTAENLMQRLERQRRLVDTGAQIWENECVLSTPLETDDVLLDGALQPLVETAVSVDELRSLQVSAPDLLEKLMRRRNRMGEVVSAASLLSAEELRAGGGVHFHHPEHLDGSAAESDAARRGSLEALSVHVRELAQLFQTGPEGEAGLRHRVAARKRFSTPSLAHLKASKKRSNASSVSAAADLGSDELTGIGEGEGEGGGLGGDGGDAEQPSKRDEGQQNAGSDAGSDRGSAAEVNFAVSQMNSEVSAEATLSVDRDPSQPFATDLNWGTLSRALAQIESTSRLSSSLLEELERVVLPKELHDRVKLQLLSNEDVIQRLIQRSRGLWKRLDSRQVLDEGGSHRTAPSAKDGGGNDTASNSNSNGHGIGDKDNNVDSNKDEDDDLRHSSKTDRAAGKGEMPMEQEEDNDPDSDSEQALWARHLSFVQRLTEERIASRETLVKQEEEAVAKQAEKQSCARRELERLREELHADMQNAEAQLKSFEEEEDNHSSQQEGASDLALQFLRHEVAQLRKERLTLLEQVGTKNFQAKRIEKLRADLTAATEALRELSEENAEGDAAAAAGDIRPTSTSPKGSLAGNEEEEQGDS